MPHHLPSESLGFLVADISRLMRAEMDRRIAEAGFGLTPGEARALAYARRTGEVRQAVLAETMGVEAMTMSTYLDRLEARGLVERMPDPTDRRAKLVRLTADAAQVLDDVSEVSADLRADLSRDMAPGEWTELLAKLVAVRATLHDMRAAGRRERDAA